MRIYCLFAVTSWFYTRNSMCAIKVFLTISNILFTQETCGLVSYRHLATRERKLYEIIDEQFSTNAINTRRSIATGNERRTYHSSLPDKVSNDTSMQIIPRNQIQNKIAFAHNDWKIVDSRSVIPKLRLWQSFADVYVIMANYGNVYTSR